MFQANCSGMLLGELGTQPATTLEGREMWSISGWVKSVPTEHESDQHFKIKLFKLIN